MSARLVLCAAVAAVLPSLAATNATVRVGRYFEPGYCDRLEDGSVVGANEDYVGRIADYSGWNVEWVVGDYRDLLGDLEAGRIDVLPGVAVTDERLRDCLVPRLSTGMYRTYLFCRSASPYEESRPEGWKGAVIGTGPGARQNAALRAFLEANRIDCELKEYASSVEAVLGFFRGESQILHTTGHYTLAIEKILHSFPPVPTYVAVSNRRKDVFADVENAMARINTETPGFASEVQRRHFITRRANTFFLTEAERLYLRRRVSSGDPVKVDVFPLVEPLKGWDEAEKRPTGFVRGLFEELSRRTGIRFSFLPPVDADTVRTRYERGQVEIWASYKGDLSGISRKYESSKAISFPLVIVCRRSARYSDPTAGRIVLPRWDYEWFRAGHPDAIKGILAREKMADCIAAVKDGTVDCTMCPVGTAVAMVRELDPEGILDIRPVSDRIRRIVFPISFSPHCDPELVSIVTKALSSFDPGDVESCMAETVVEISRNRVPASVVVAMVLVCAAGLLSLFVGGALLRRARGIRESAAIRERSAESRNELLVRGVRSLMTSAEIVSSRAEFLRDPDVTREQALGWTADIIGHAEDMITRLNSFRVEAEGSEAKTSELDKIRGG